MSRRLVLLALLLFPASASAQLVLDDEVPDDGSDFLMLPFTVPAGTVEIEIRHDDMSATNILDWGVHDPDGFRGWGGGNDEPAVIGVEAASRSYLAGPIEAGEWAVVVGKALIVDAPARYHVEIDFRTVATLPADTERAPYTPVAALSSGPRWYAGDFHAHSRESGDASPTVDALATFARDRGLDFVELSDHNTSSQVELIAMAQPRHPELLLLPGVEFTTYDGHANGIGATQYVDHRMGVDGVTILTAFDALHAQGALVSINHPVLDLGDNCIGCAWDHDVPAEMIDAVEIETGGWSQTGYLFTRQAIDFWDALCDTGAHVAAIGGSDDHAGGAGSGGFYSPVGEPTTMVWADELSVAAIVAGVRAGRTVVKLQRPDDPMVELFAGDDHRLGDTVTETQVTLTVRVTGGMGDTVRLVRNGVAMSGTRVDADPFELALEIDAPYGDAEDRWRAELLAGRDLRVVTSHLYVAPQPGEPPPDAGPEDAGASMDAGGTEPDPAGGCGCRAAGAAERDGAGEASLLCGLLLVIARPRRPRGRQHLGSRALARTPSRLGHRPSCPVISSRECQ